MFPALFVEVRMDRLTQSDAKIGLLQHVGGGNLGDDATLAAVAANISPHSPDDALTCGARTAIQLT